MVRAQVEEIDPSFTFTSLPIVSFARANLHVDQGNSGPPMAVALGPYSGGELCIHDPEGGASPTSSVSLTVSSTAWNARGQDVGVTRDYERLDGSAWQWNRYCVWASPQCRRIGALRGSLEQGWTAEAATVVETDLEAEAARVLIAACSSCSGAAANLRLPLS